MLLLSASIYALDFCSELNNGDVLLPEDLLLSCILKAGRFEFKRFVWHQFCRLISYKNAENVIQREKHDAQGSNSNASIICTVSKHVVISLKYSCSKF